MKGLEVAELSRGARREAARLLTDAFLDDPAWVGIGPDHVGLRRAVLRCYYGAALVEALRWGGPSWCARRDGRALGIAIAWSDGETFPAAWATALEAPAFVLAGPPTMLRGLRADSVMKRAHPHEPHLYLWFLAAHPSAQRQGVGRALMNRVLEQAAARDVPIYLETTKPENVPYYRSFGFAVIDEAALPRGARIWFMWRAR